MWKPSRAGVPFSVAVLSLMSSVPVIAVFVKEMAFPMTLLAWEIESTE